MHTFGVVPIERLPAKGAHGRELRAQGEPDHLVSRRGAIESADPFSLHVNLLACCRKQFCVGFKRVLEQRGGQKRAGN